MYHPGLIDPKSAGANRRTILTANPTEEQLSKQPPLACPRIPSRRFSMSFVRQTLIKLPWTGQRMFSFYSEGQNRKATDSPPMALDFVSTESVTGFTGNSPHCQLV